MVTIIGADAGNAGRELSLSYQLARLLAGRTGSFSVKTLQNELRGRYSGEAVRAVLDRWLAAGALVRVNTHRPARYQVRDLDGLTVQRFHAGRW